MNALRAHPVPGELFCIPGAVRFGRNLRSLYRQRRNLEGGYRFFGELFRGTSEKAVREQTVRIAPRVITLLRHLRRCPVSEHESRGAPCQKKYVRNPEISLSGRPRFRKSLEKPKPALKSGTIIRDQETAILLLVPNHSPEDAR